MTRYVSESMFATMMRTRNKDPIAMAEIKGKTGEVDTILWQRRYIKQLLKDYPMMFEVDGSAAKGPLQKLQALSTSPLAMYELMESANRDLTFSQSLPNEPIRMFFKHLHDVFAGYYSPEVKGAFSGSAADRWN